VWMTLTLIRCLPLKAFSRKSSHFSLVLVKFKVKYKNNIHIDKQQLKEREAKVLELAVALCSEYLDEECTELCAKLVQKLGRKRSCPL